MIFSGRRVSRYFRVIYHLDDVLFYLSLVKSSRKWLFYTFIRLVRL